MGFGLDFEKLLVIGLIAVLLIGPERLPHYAEQFAKLVRRGGELLRDTRSRVQEEMGPEVADVDWRKLDPRQYDPRRIIRDALFEDSAPAPIAPSAPVAAPAPTPPPAPRVMPVFTRTSPPPFDPEAT
ncbi:Sec-independent protein translocase TatB [Microbacterium sp. CIAB417]|uniref:Sec-independent protein translocase TatB n=1 Tax=Microbacterium sp. CIAB417 TaxID=2860287 RepID=UPI001FAB5F4B|nr:Sec-independent protein translocase TatB [Microbacterium sp. CIAB417]